MSLQKVLEDWSDYESRKSGCGNVVQEFNCGEEWEVHYLVDRIKKIYPAHAGSHIQRAIFTCCKQRPVSHQRNAFVKSVLNTLGIFV